MNIENPNQRSRKHHLFEILLNFICSLFNSCSFIVKFGNNRQPLQIILARSQMEPSIMCANFYLTRSRAYLQGRPMDITFLNKSLDYPFGQLFKVVTKHTVLSAKVHNVFWHNTLFFPRPYFKFMPVHIVVGLIEEHTRCVGNQSE